MATMRRAGTLVFALTIVGTLLHGQGDGDWPAYGRDAGGERFSPLAEIHRGNVASLQVAWTFRTGDAYKPERGRPTAFEATPLHVDGTLYVSTPVGRVIALDPATGHERWVFDAKVPRDAGYGDFASRGVSAWRRNNERRIFVATIDARLIALDAATGRPIPGFGDGGTVDLRRGLRIAPRGFADYQVTSPPAVIGNTVVVGSAIQDNARTEEPSGEVRGFDAITGALKWRWDPIPQDPSAVGADTWKNQSATRTGAANAWSVIVADAARNLVFVPTSSPSPDYFGGERPGHNLFANSVVALRADTGARVWHFQTVHHDLWDYDVASPPLLFEWRRNGRGVPAIAIASKTGHLFVLNRETGRPLMPIEERAVPKSDVPGEQPSPTQPFPTAPRSLARTSLKADEAWGLTDDDRAWCRETINRLRADGFFTPPSLRGSLLVPGNVGGMAWGGMAHDRPNGLLIMPVNNLAAEVRLLPRADAETERASGRLDGDFEYAAQQGTPYAVIRRLLRGPKTGLPCTPPPWGTLAAVNPTTGAIAWQVPLGQFPGLDQVPDAARWGSIALGGPIATAGGLVFTAGTLDPAIYAFDVKTGQQLWKGTLPTSARSTPMTYRASNGRQYVVVSAGGHGLSGGPPLGDYLVAFALPETSVPAQKTAPSPRLAAGTHMVTVDGVPMRARLAGLEHLGKAPVIVFEAGARSRLETWDPVFADVATFAPAIAYDRAGNGQSPTDNQPATPAHIAERLHALLGAVGIPPPYVLVGHSWGGPLIRMFAGLYPSEIAGLLFVDSTDLRTEEEDRAYLRGQGFSDEAAAAHRAEQWTRMKTLGPEMLAAAESGAGYYKEFRSLPPIPDVPVTAFVSDLYQESIWPPGPCVPRACHEFSVKFRTERWTAVTRSVRNGTLILATGRSHEIHVDDPQLVIAAIRRTVNASGALKPASRR